MKWRAKVSLVVGLALLAGAPAAAEETTAIRTGLSYGSSKSAYYDLYLQHTFDPWLDRAGYRLAPYANLGFGFLSGDKDGHPEYINDQLWTMVAALGLRYEMKVRETFHPYLAFNVGPSYVSENEFLGRTMGGGHYLFNLRASLGAFFGETRRHNLGFDLSHYSNAYTKSSNKGYNAMGLSYGYSFW